MTNYTIEKWVLLHGGIKKTAKTLGVTTHCVRVWLRGEGVPRAHTIFKMVKLSGRKLTFEGICIDSTRNCKGKERLSC